MKLTEAFSKPESYLPDYHIPSYDREAIRKETMEHPTWLHFGAGNIFRAFMAHEMDKLIELGASKTGIIVCEDFDKELVEKAYQPYDSLSLLVTLRADGTIGKDVVGSVVEAVTDETRMEELFCKPSVQMVSFTITEKGYAGPLMRKICLLCLKRFQAGAYPVALVSMDNCAHNGEILYQAIMKHAASLVEEGFADREFILYLTDRNKVSFPWSMIDKITPRPDANVQEMLKNEGFEDCETIITGCHTYTAPFVNAEETEYLVIEDCFPNGRPALEKVGILFTERETVDKTEKMKVGTCLNPLHTALAIFGCLLGYETIHDEMNDEDLKKMVWKLGYVEGMPVVVNPGIMDPHRFLDDVLSKRLPNPFMPDTPQRIVTDTSQKIPVRFGQTLERYQKNDELDITELNLIPMVFAGWLRYLMGVDDKGVKMQLSSDPRLVELTQKMSACRMGSVLDEEVVNQILADRTIFVIDLYECGIADKVKKLLLQMTRREGSVREVLRECCKG